MQVDFFGNKVRCETEGLLVSLNDLLIAGNSWRVQNNLPCKNLFDIISTKSFFEFKEAVKKSEGKTDAEILKAIKGRNGRTMAHIFLAIYVAEQMSPDFHVQVIKTFVKGKLLEFRDYGGAEFKVMNVVIDQYILSGQGEKEDYIKAARALRTRILGKDAVSGDWDKATIEQTHQRYDMEHRITDFIRMGFVKDINHLVAVIAKL